MHAVQRSVFLAFLYLLPSYHFCFICYSSLLVSSFSFYLSRTLKRSVWCLKSSKYIVCSPFVHFIVIYSRKSEIRNSTLYHPPLYVTHPGLSSLVLSPYFFFFYWLLVTVWTLNSEALASMTHYCLLVFFFFSSFQST